MPKKERPRKEKPLYKTWREIPIPRVLEVFHADGTVEDVCPKLEKSYAPQEKRGVRTLQIGLNLYHWWRDLVTREYGEEVARKMVMEIGKRWGQLTAELLKGPPIFLDPKDPPDVLFKKYCEGTIRTSFPMCEVYEVEEVGKNKIIWRTLACRQFIPWRDGFHVLADLPPDPELCHEQCDQWWEWMNKGLSPKLRFRRTKAMGTDGLCEWEVWIEE
ncbi:MAG: hypothetical protein ACE5OY_00585 [Candidatus Bathyarchaeia archaeon]